MSEYYNESYYSNKDGSGCGSNYHDRENWTRFFNSIADRIVADFNPKTVLDVGCAFGYLVEALRDRGVEAYGIDISNYAINNVRKDLKSYCSVQAIQNNLPNSFPQKFDLITNIEVIEHIPEEDCEECIKRMCSYGNTIIFSSTSEDFTEPTHINVQQPEYWVKKFAANGFYDDKFYSLDYLSPYAHCFKKQEKIQDVIEQYEHKVRLLRNELKNKNNFGISKIYSNVYFDFGEGFSSENSVNYEFKKSDIILKVDLPKTVKSVRYDPLEFYGGILKNLQIFSNKGKVPEELIQVVNGAFCDDYIVFYDSDPQIMIDIENQDFNYLEITANIIPLDSLQKKEFVSKCENGIKNLKNTENKLYEQKNQIDVLSNQVNALNNQIQDYSNLVAYERGEANKVKNHLSDIENELSIIKNSTTWKITKPIRFCIDVLKKIFRLFLTPFRTIKSSFKKNKIREKNNNNVSIVRKDNFLKENTSLIKMTGNPIEAIDTIFVDTPVKRLNLVTDSINSDSLLGGVATALIVASEFANTYGYELRIITRQADTNPVNYSNIMKISGIKAAEKVSFFSDVQRKNGAVDFKLEITEEDIFFATSWWSAKAIDETILKGRFFYIIQEVESFFYNYGPEHLLCSQMMEQKNIDYIINSHYLNNYFSENLPNITNNGCYFEPAFPKKLYKCQKFVKKNKYKLFFYARPNNPRNLFSFGIEMLNNAIKSGILDMNEWEVVCAGQDVPEIVFSNGSRVKNMGQMKWSDYADFLTTVDLGLCLMYTPHPSYPPFDVACSGGVVLSNKAFNKTEFEFCDNVILADIYDGSYLESFKKAVTLAKNPDQRRKNYECSTIPREWHESLKQTIKFMGDCLKNV